MRRAAQIVASAQRSGPASHHSRPVLLCLLCAPTRTAIPWVFPCTNTGQLHLIIAPYYRNLLMFLQLVFILNILPWNSGQDIRLGVPAVWGTSKSPRPEGKATLFDLNPCARCGRPAYGYGQRTYCPGCKKRSRPWGPALFLVLILLGTLAASLTAPYWLPLVPGRG